ncbi:MAG TPA: hypothetical protein DCS19_05070 [Flavobacterium sp.]|nr:hypothetical protein [Flavobacterium sp.]
MSKPTKHHFYSEKDIREMKKKYQKDKKMIDNIANEFHNLHFKFFSELWTNDHENRVLKHYFKVDSKKMNEIMSLYDDEPNPLQILS